MSNTTKPDSPATAGNAFDRIYATHEWEGTSLSGPGSDAERTTEFRIFLEQYLRKHSIRSVLDFGCGDWSYGRLVNWGSTRYTGIDVVESVIEQNQRAFARDGVQFLRVAPDAQDLPPADLLIAKEVLQHLPSSRVHEILRMARNYSHVILVNDIEHTIRGGWRQLWRWTVASPTNVDIEPGSYRLLALREPPFSFPATRALVYGQQYRQRRWTKEVLVYAKPAPAKP